MITEHVNRIPVHLDGKTIYDIVLEDSFDALAKEISALGTEKKKICIVSDSNVADLYLDEVTKILSGCCREVTSYVFPAGEENKNLKTVQGAYEHLILNHYDRKDLLVAHGRPLRICGCNLTPRRGFCPDPDNTVVPGGLRNRRKDRCRL